MPAKVATKQGGKGNTVPGIQKNKKNKKDSPSKMSAKKRNQKKIEDVPAEEEESGSDLGSDISDLDSENEALDEEVTSDDEQSEGVTKQKAKNGKKSPKQAEGVDSEEIPRDQPLQTVFVGNLPKDITKKTLLKMFCDYGKISTLRLRSAPVADVRVPKKVAVIRKDFHADRTNINAYVVFTTEEGAQKALVANGSIVEGRHIRVSMLNNSDIDVKKAVFIGNVPFGADEEQLRAAFASCGNITSVRIVRHSEQGIGKGFAYINFTTTEAVEVALLKDGTELLKRPMRVQRCKELLSAPRKRSNLQRIKKKEQAANQGGQNRKRGDKKPFAGQKTAGEGKVQKKKKAKKVSPKKKAAVETLAKSMAKAGKKNKKQA